MTEREEADDRIQSRFLAEFYFQSGPPNELGETPRGRRRVVYLTEGHFSGPRLNGTVVPGGGDCALVRADGVFEADVRLLLQCDDGAQILMTYRGLMHATPEALNRLLRREPGVGPDDYYFRTAIFFETADPRYEWLNRILAVGVGQPVPSDGQKDAMAIRYRAYEVI